MKRKKGFTLIELLIVIAIIGILALVLIPNLLRARQSANETAARVHSGNVYTAVVAELSDDPNATAMTITAAQADCTAEYEFDETAGFLGVGWNAPPPPVDTCVIAPDGADDFTVTVTTVNGFTYVNNRDAGVATP